MKKEQAYIILIKRKQFVPGRSTSRIKALLWQRTEQQVQWLESAWKVKNESFRLQSVCLPNIEAAMLQYREIKKAQGMRRMHWSQVWFFPNLHNNQQHAETITISAFKTFQLWGTSPSIFTIKKNSVTQCFIRMMIRLIEKCIYVWWLKRAFISHPVSPSKSKLTLLFQWQSLFVE